ERLVGEVGERRPAPETEGLAQHGGCVLCLAACERGARVLREPLESVQVELVGRDADHVAGRSRLDRRVGAERLPELRDLALYLRDGGHRRGAGVEVVREALDRDDTVRVQEQDREGCALPRSAEWDGAALLDDLQRSQDAELDQRETDGSRSIAIR